ncbi:hypothetical protein VP01_3264g2, partial [Puccinia sorghi]
GLQDHNTTLPQKHHMLQYIRWLYCCIPLHNMLAQLGNLWSTLAEDLPDLVEPEDLQFCTLPWKEHFRSAVKAKCPQFNHHRGLLPIPSKLAAL